MELATVGLTCERGNTTGARGSAQSPQTTADKVGSRVPQEKPIKWGAVGAAAAGTGLQLEDDAVTAADEKEEDVGTAGNLYLCVYKSGSTLSARSADLDLGFDRNDLSILLCVV